jgi:hypothetical protein
MKIFTVLVFFFCAFNFSIAQNTFPVTYRGIQIPQQIIGTFEMKEEKTNNFSDEPSPREFLIITPKGKTFVNIVVVEKTYEAYNLESYTGFISEVDDVLFLNLFESEQTDIVNDDDIDLSGISQYNIFKLDLLKNSFYIKKLIYIDRNFKNQEVFYEFCKKNKGNSFFYDLDSYHSMNNKTMIKL